MSRESNVSENQTKMFIFWVSILIILVLIGSGLRKLLSNADEAAMVSMDTLRASFSERVQLIHVYWINNGKKSPQFLDVQGWDDEDTVRIAYKLNSQGWVVDAGFVGKRKNLGTNPCERLWESILQKSSFEVMGKIQAQTVNHDSACTYNVSDDGYMKYTFSDGAVRLYGVPAE